MKDLRTDDADWRSGRTWSLVYSAGEEHESVVKQAYNQFYNENGLSPAAFHSLEVMEREVVSMLLEHLGANPDTAGGTMASGGTESIILAAKAYRDRAEHLKPSIVIPTTAHPAFVKAGQLLGVEVRLTPVDESFRADPEAMADRVDESTIFVGASAPCFPFGVVDPIELLGEIARDRGIGLHVDSCLGGIALPFLRDMGRAVPQFDFSIQGVTSMSVDLHKYGFGPKGTSAVLYRDRTLRRAQFTVYEDWPGGALASPTLLGTRPGGGIAGAWAAIHHLGRAGYTEIFRSIMEATDSLRRGIESIGDLRILGDPPMSVFAFTSDAKDIHSIADHLEERGWRIDRQSKPDSIHLIVNPTHVKVVDMFLTDLGEAYAKAGPKTSRERTSIYGVTSRVADVDDVREAILDELQKRYDAHEPLTHLRMQRDPE
jgi:glutamate/tyrosine decarboxylase-like PLP-dependent enzyme